MRFTLGGFQQDPDDGEANHGAAGVTHKNFIAAAEGAKIKKNIGQNGGDHRKTPHRQAVLAIKPKDDPGRRKGDR